MTSIVDTPEEAAELELEPLLVRRPLEGYLDGCGLGSGPVRAEPVGEGHSNITYLISRATTTSGCSAGPPRGRCHRRAHDVLREARLLTAVQDADVRTPQMLATCDDEEVIGAPFYVMERIEGDVITTEMPERLDDTGAARARSAKS